MIRVVFFLFVFFSLLATAGQNDSAPQFQTQIQNPAGTIVDPTQIRPLNSATDSVAASITGTTAQGAPNTVANGWPVKLTDGTNTTAVKAASTAAIATDPAAVVTLSPNGNQATAALQATANTSLANIDAGIPTALGQTTMANSMPVTIASDQTPIKIAKTALGNNSATAVSVGTGNTSVLGSNTNRTGVVLMNLSSSNISFGLAGASAVLNNGITLYPGGVWVMDEFTFTTGAINAIAGAAASSLAVQEFQ